MQHGDAELGDSIDCQAVHCYTVHCYATHSNTIDSGTIGCAEYHHAEQHAHLRPHRRDWFADFRTGDGTDSSAESPADRRSHADTIGLADGSAHRNAHYAANSKVLRTAYSNCALGLALHARGQQLCSGLARLGLAITTLSCCCMQPI